MKLLTFLLIFTSSAALAKSEGLEKFVKEYNKNRSSKEAYLGWLAKYETKENVDFLKKYLDKNPQIELRTLELVGEELAFRGKKSYTRVSVVSLKDGKIKMYGKERHIPLFKPYESVLGKESSGSKKLDSAASTIFSLFISTAFADGAEWTGESIDIFTSTRIWYRTTFSSTAFSNGMWSAYCRYGAREGNYDQIVNMFGEFDPEDFEDNCHQVLLNLGEVVTHYNDSMEGYDEKKREEARQLGRELDYNNKPTQMSNLSQELATPECILKSIKAWRVKYCRQMGKGLLQGCSIIGSKPPAIFKCGTEFDESVLPEKIGISIQYKTPIYNTDGIPGPSRGADRP